MKWRFQRIFGDSDSSPLHLFILRLQLSNTLVLRTKEPRDSSHDRSGKISNAGGASYLISHCRFLVFVCVFLRFGVSNFLKGTELSEVQNFWHPARFRILRRRISIRDSDFGKLPDSYPTRVGFACGTREFRAAHGQLGWALCSVCDASGCLCWHILFCVTEGQKFSFGWNGCLLAHTVLLKELRSVICDVNQCCSASFPLLISLKGC